MPLKTDGAKIRALRERQALTLTEFAELLGYAMNSVHLIEVGKANGGPKFIRAAVRILGCRIEDITNAPDNTLDLSNPDRASSHPCSNAARRSPRAAPAAPLPRASSRRRDH